LLVTRELLLLLLLLLLPVTCSTADCSVFLLKALHLMPTV
jgi:hypothetical protein